MPENAGESYAIQLCVCSSPEQDRMSAAGDVRETAGSSVMSLYSDHMLLICMEDFQTIQEFQSDDVIYPASLTKIMTAILAIEALDDPDGQMVIQPEWIAQLQEKNASMAGFLPMESVSVRDLLYGALLPSGADAAVALACAVSGSEEAFVELMNQKAHSLGMGSTHFVNTTGLHDDRHVTTLRDLSLLLDYALDNPVFRQIFTARGYQTEATALHENGMYLESTLFGRLDRAAREDERIGEQGSLRDSGWILGGKTGYTPQAGLCLASLARIHDKDYMLLTAGACGDTQTLPYHILDAVEVYTHLP